MIKYTRIFVLLFLIVVLFSCRKENYVLTNPDEQSVAAFQLSLRHKPIKALGSFWFINGEFQFISIDSTGILTQRQDLAPYFADAGIEDAIYNHFECSYSEEAQSFEISAMVEGTIFEKYYSTTSIEMDVQGNILKEINYRIPGVDTSYAAEYIGIKKTQTAHYSFLSHRERKPDVIQSLMITKYDPATQHQTDSIVPIVLRGEIASVIIDNDIYNVLYYENGPGSSLMYIKQFDMNFQELNTVNIGINGDLIFYTKKLSSGHYIIAGTNSNFNSEENENYFTAEIDLSGTVYWKNDNYGDAVKPGEFIYFYDMIETGDSLISCGMYSESFGYSDFSTLATHGSSSLFIAGVGGDYFRPYFKKSSPYGASAGICVMQTQYGFAMLTYMSDKNINPIEESLWLYKLDSDFSLKDY